MYIRPSTHSNSWYSGNGKTLLKQLDGYAEAARTKLGTSSGIAGARVLIGPHAGYTYSGPRLAETFEAWDMARTKRVFILGPSHHVWFQDKVLVSKFDAYSTPFGDLPVDKEVNKKLVASGSFQYMSEEADEDEHSFEMHCPFIYYKAKALPELPKIVPIMISSMDDGLSEKVVSALEPYFRDEENTFVISSDFCHWGSRFGYTEYLKRRISQSSAKLDLITLRSPSSLGDLEIWESIEALDRHAMGLASSAGSREWKQYIKDTKNTICGQKPVYLVLKLLEATRTASRFEWVGYSQSSHAKSVFDSSVSYASGYVSMNRAI